MNCLCTPRYFSFQVVQIYNFSDAAISRRCKNLEVQCVQTFNICHTSVQGTRVFPFKNPRIREANKGLEWSSEKELLSFGATNNMVLIMVEESVELTKPAHGRWDID